MHSQGICKSHSEDPLEVCLAHFGYDFDDDSVICEVNALLDSTPLLDTNKWKRKLEPLVFSDSRLVPSVENALTLTHKPLSSEFFRLDDINNETVLDDNGSMSRDIIAPLSSCSAEIISADLELDLERVPPIKTVKQSEFVAYGNDLLIPSMHYLNIT